MLSKYEEEGRREEDLSDRKRFFGQGVEGHGGYNLYQREGYGQQGVQEGEEDQNPPR